MVAPLVIAGVLILGVSAVLMLIFGAALLIWAAFNPIPATIIVIGFFALVGFIIHARRGKAVAPKRKR